MGYGLSVFLVPLSELERVRANDQELLQAALENLQEALSDYDAQMGAPNPDNDADLSHADALKELFAGKFTPHVPGARYGWAFECLCAFIGTRLDNDGLIPCTWDWYERLDRILEQRGLSLRFSKLISDSPIAFPEPDDWPCVGHWPASVADERGALEQVVNDLIYGNAEADEEEKDDEGENEDGEATDDGADDEADERDANASDASDASDEGEQGDEDDGAWNALDTASYWLMDMEYEDGSIIVGFHG